MALGCQGSTKHLWAVLLLSSVYPGDIEPWRGENTLNQAPELVSRRVGM